MDKGETEYQDLTPWSHRCAAPLPVPLVPLVVAAALNLPRARLSFWQDPFQNETVDSPACSVHDAADFFGRVHTG